MLVHTATAELWTHGAVTCVLVPHGHNVDVELRNADGSAFLRKTAPNRQAALNEAEYLRLLLRPAQHVVRSSELKPFALVIEDDADNRDALSDALKMTGMRVLGCGTGAEGVALALELLPDLVVVDHRLPDVTGTDVCRHLRNQPQTATTAIIAVTAAPEALRLEGCDADAVLSKPYQLDTLIAAARLFVRDLGSATDGTA
ncbi:MAG TPA: response regulator [Vicinamibacterales bacterium]|nr:response regulator [Vicinamibacterales bacterium]